MQVAVVLLTIFHTRCFSGCTVIEVCTVCHKTIVSASSLESNAVVAAAQQQQRLPGEVCVWLLAVGNAGVATTIETASIICTYPMI